MIAHPMPAPPGATPLYALRLPEGSTISTRFTELHTVVDLWVRVVHISGTLGSEWTEKKERRLELGSRKLVFALAYELGAKVLRVLGGSRDRP